MLRYAAEQPHISLQGLTDWDKGAAEAGLGLAKLVQGGARLVQEREKVTDAGNLAEFSRTLRSIEAETRDEMQGQDPADWHHAWRAAQALRVAEAVAALPAGLRPQALQMAEEYNREAAVRALRDRELDRINQARSQWQQRVDDAVEAGDAEAAQQWLEHGRGVFVPEARMQEESAAVGSRAQLSRWRHRLQLSPLETVGDYLQLSPKQLALGKTEAEQLQQDMRRTQTEAKNLLADTLRQRAFSGESTSAQEWQQAGRAGLISASQLASAQQHEPEPSTHTLNDWTRRVDECDTAPEAARDLVLGICTSGLPLPRQAELLQRMQQSGGAAVADRRALSHSLWNLYHGGAFGCPGDEMAAQRLRRLMAAGMPLLVEQGSASAAQWLESLDRRSEQWVCFESQHA